MLKSEPSELSSTLSHQLPSNPNRNTSKGTHFLIPPKCISHAPVLSTAHHLLPDLLSNSTPAHLHHCKPLYQKLGVSLPIGNFQWFLTALQMKPNLFRGLQSPAHSPHATLSLSLLSACALLIQHPPSQSPSTQALLLVLSSKPQSTFIGYSSCVRPGHCSLWFHHLSHFCNIYFCTCLPPL